MAVNPAINSSNLTFLSSSYRALAASRAFVTVSRSLARSRNSASRLRYSARMLRFGRELLTSSADPQIVSFISMTQKKREKKKKPRLTFKFGNVSLQCCLIRSSQFVGRILFEFHIALLLLLPGRRFSCNFILMLSTRSILFIHLASIIHLFLIFIRNSCFILLLLVILATLHITMSSILVATSSTLTQCRQALDPLISSHRTGTFPGFLSIFSHCLQSAAYNPSARCL